MDKHRVGPTARFMDDDKAASALAMVRLGVEERSLLKLQAAFDLDPKSVAKSWRQTQSTGGMALETMALPEAARAGWAQGIELLARWGVNPRLADADRQGFVTGKAPIAEALSKGYFDAALALFNAGAKLDHLSNLVWAAGFQAHHNGASAGIAVLDWMEARGMDPWADDGKASAAQSAYLFTGSLRQLDDAATLAWEARLFRGMGDGPGAMACLWLHMYCLSSGVDKSRSLCERYMELAGVGAPRSKRAREMLEKSLMGGCPVGAAVAAEGLEPLGTDWEALGGAALQAACEDRNHSENKDPAKKGEAVRALWKVVGDRLGAHRPALERACFKAMLNGNTGLFEGLMEVSNLSAKEVMAHWRAGMPGSGDRAHSPRRAQWERCTVAAMSKQLREPGSEPKLRALRLFEAFDPPTHKGVDQDRFDRMFAQAERHALESQASPILVTGVGGAARIRL